MFRYVDKMGDDTNRNRNMDAEMRVASSRLFLSPLIRSDLILTKILYPIDRQAGRKIHSNIPFQAITSWQIIFA